MPAEVRIKIVDESGPAPLTGNGTGGGGGSGDYEPAAGRTRAPVAPRAKPVAPAKKKTPEELAKERQKWRVARGEAWRRNKRRERLRERIQERRQLRRQVTQGALNSGALGSGSIVGAGRNIGGAIGGYVGAAAGPLGAIVGQAVGAEVGEVVGNVVRTVTRPFELLGRAAQFTAEGFKKVAADDGFGALMHAGEGVASVMEKIPIVGSVLADNFRGLTAVVGAVHGVMEAFAERGKQLGVYSGAISAASARQEVAGQLRDMREAQRMGDGYAKLIDKQTEFEAAMSGLLMPIKEIIVERLPQLIDWFLDNVQGMFERIDNAIPFTTTIFGDMAKEMKKAREEAKKFGTDELESAWLSFRGGFGAVAFPPMPGALGVPLTVGAAP